ncbi:hypothetical protein N7535_006731 [Penicillium sp. DV-2018c]|nr:hypothetical protein N7535_006731 [Penicillium sp. DV-2018c]
MTQFFTAKFMGELLTGKAGRLPEDHRQSTFKESVSPKIASTLSEFQQPAQPDKMWSTLASECGTNNVFYVQKLQARQPVAQADKRGVWGPP